MSDSKPEICVPGDDNRFSGTDDVSATREVHKNEVNGAGPKAGSETISENDISGSRPDVFLDGGSALGIGTSKGTPEILTGKLGRRPQNHGNQGCASRKGCVVPSMVVGGIQSDEGQTMEGSSTKYPHYGCKFVGMGGACKSHRLPREMDKTGIPEVFQLEGIEGCKPGIDAGSVDPVPIPRVSTVRQCNNSGLCQQTGRHEIPVVAGGSGKDLFLGRKQYIVIESGPSQRDAKPRSGQTKQKQSSVGRMVSEQRGICSDYKKMGDPINRSVCDRGKCASSKVLFTKSKGQSLGGKCIQPEMGFSANVCLPSSEHDSKCSQQMEGMSEQNASDCTYLAKKELVCHDKGISSRESVASTSKGRSSVSGENLASKSKSAKSGSVDPELTWLRSLGISDKAATTLMGSRKEVTRKIYLKYWKTFCAWLQKSKFSTMSIPAVLDFLQEGWDKNISVNTLKVQIAALTALSGIPISSSPLVVRFLKALSRKTPVYKPYVSPWDLSVVLQGLVRPPFEPLKESSLKFVTLKTIFLVAITTARRVSELQSLSVKSPYFQDFQDRLVLQTDPKFSPKVMTKFHRTQDIVLPTFCVNPSREKEKLFHTLDVRRCVLQYIESTAEIRKSDSLFVLFFGKNAGQRASKSTIAGWIKSAIVEAYKVMGVEAPPSFRAHSTRAMAASWANNAGASPEQICKAATWSSLSTFIRHYRIDALSANDQAFGRKVLQAVVPP